MFLFLDVLPGPELIIVDSLAYLVHCRHALSHGGCRLLLCAACIDLAVPFAHTAMLPVVTYCTLCSYSYTATTPFSVVGLVTWNGLPKRYVPSLGSFYRLLETALFHLAWVQSASELGS